MKEFTLSGTPASLFKFYDAKAWIAVDSSSNPLVIVYMGQFQFDRTLLPKWVQSIMADNPSGYDMLRWSSTTELSKIKKAAIRGGHEAVGPRGGYIKATTIARTALHEIATARREQFTQWRKKARGYLEMFGTVYSGEVYGDKFIVKED